MLVKGSVKDTGLCADRVVDGVAQTQTSSESQSSFPVCRLLPHSLHSTIQTYCKENVLHKNPTFILKTSPMGGGCGWGDRAASSNQKVGALSQSSPSACRSVLGQDTEPIFWSKYLAFLQSQTPPPHTHMRTKHNPASVSRQPSMWKSISDLCAQIRPCEHSPVIVTTVQHFLAHRVDCWDTGGGQRLKSPLVIGHFQHPQCLVWR